MNRDEKMLEDAVNQIMKSLEKLTQRDKARLLERMRKVNAKATAA